MISKCGEHKSYKVIIWIRNLHDFDKEALLSELEDMTIWLSQQTVLEDIALDFRI